LSSFRIMKFRLKITIITAILFLLSFAAASVLIISNVGKETKTLLNERASGNAKFLSSEIDRLMTQEAAYIDGESSYFSTILESDKNQITDYLNGIVAKDNTIVDAYIAQGDGSHGDGLYYSDPFYSDKSSELCISISKDFNYEDGQKGTITIDVSIAELFS